LVWDAYHRRPLFWKACALTVALAVFLALMLLYRTAEASRHTLVLDILLLAALLLENPRPAAGAAAGAAALALAGVLALTANGGFALPPYRAELAAEVDA